MSDPLWETHADWWQREFTEGADPEYTEQILPLASRLLAGYSTVVDIGAGEGQVARLLAANGTRVIGIEAAEAQVDEARRRGGGVPYVRAVAGAVPVATGAVDAAVACLVFEHIDDHEGAIAEVARVLRPGGRFVFLLNHPLLQTPGSGWIDDHVLDPPEQYWRIGPYLRAGASVEEVQKGVFIRFVHRPLSSYVNTMARVGLLLTEMIEPAPPPGFVAKAPEYPDAASIPRLLVLVTERVAGSIGSAACQPSAQPAH